MPISADTMEISDVISFESWELKSVLLSYPINSVVKV